MADRAQHDYRHVRAVPTAITTAICARRFQIVDLGHYRQYRGTIRKGHALTPQPPTLLRVLATERHWQTYRVFAGRFTAAADELAEREKNPALRGISVSERTYDRWFAGNLVRGPQADQCRVLEAMFDGIPVSQLLASAPVPFVGKQVVPALTSPAVPVTIELERQVEMAARRAFRFASIAEGNAVGPETIGHVQQEVFRIAGAYPRLPLTTILGDLVDVQDITFQLLEGQGHVRPADARDLYLYAAMASGMLAKASHDVGDPRSAMMQARTAYVCADNADHHGMRAWVRGLQSLITYWDGRTNDAATYAQLGSALAEGMNGTAKVWLACLEARAYAALGDRDSASDAVQRAEEARESTSPDDLDSVGGILTFPIVRQHYYVAEAAVTGPAPFDHATATRLAKTAVGEYRKADPSEWAFGDQAGADTDLALARIAAGELEGAAEAIRPVLELPAEQRMHGVVVSARRVHEALCLPAVATVPAAREIREEIEAFSSVTTASLVRR